MRQRRSSGRSARLCARRGWPRSWSSMTARVDATAEMALAADDGSGRLRLLKLDSNRGPAFARNHAIAHSQAPLIAILDADDFFLKGRFDRLVDADDWDLVADNIVFIDARSAGLARTRRAGLRRTSRASSTCPTSSKATSRGAARARGEIGFLKPVMRRAFLDGRGLRYARSCASARTTTSMRAPDERCALQGRAWLRLCRGGARRIRSAVATGRRISSACMRPIARCWRRRR